MYMEHGSLLSQSVLGEEKAFLPTVSIQSLDKTSTSLLVCMADPKAFDVSDMSTLCSGRILQPQVHLVHVGEKSRGNLAS